MRCTMLSVVTCIIHISTSQSQSPLLRNIVNPADCVKDFADGMKEKDLHERRLLAGLEDKQEMINALERMANLASTTGTYASECDISLQIFAADLRRRKMYALRMVDSWGKLESGVLTGNVAWLGRYHECTNARGVQFSGKYFYLSFGNGTAPGYGMCLPDSCSTEDAEQIKYLLPSLLTIDVNAYHPAQPSNYTAVDIVSIIIASLLGCLVIFGTLYELYLSYKTPDDEDCMQFVNGTEKQKTPSVFSNVILSFSIIKNTRVIFDATQKEGSIDVLHGLRFFSMTWVILGHTFSFTLNVLDNGIDLSYYYFTNWSFQAVGNSTFSVDSFFFLSGLLAAYLGLKEMKKRSGKLNIPLMYAYRYLRLTPAYAFCILFITGVFSKFGGGPLWPVTVEGLRKNCRMYWWTNLLYINNLYPTSLPQECILWGWYLANDMQFFLLLPFLLYLMYRRPITGAAVLIVMVMLSMIATGVLTSHYGLQPLAVINGLILYPAVEATMLSNEGYQISQSDYSNTTDTLTSTTNAATPIPTPSLPLPFWADTYTKPWCRMDVYFIGVLTGLILYSTNTRIRMNRKLATIGWMTSTATALAVIYGLFGTIKDGQPLPVNVAAFYEAVSRAMWAFCLMWLVIACTSGYGGPINALLSWKAFIPLSRLTFCTYLIHPAIIYYVLGTMETQLHFTFPLLCFLYAGVVLISLSSGFVISILIETPMVGITKAMFGKTQGKRSNCTIQLGLAEQSKL